VDIRNSEFPTKIEGFFAGLTVGYKFLATAKKGPLSIMIMCPAAWIRAASVMTEASYDATVAPLQI